MMADSTIEDRAEIAWAAKTCQQVAERLNALLEVNAMLRQGG